MRHLIVAALAAALFALFLPTEALAYVPSPHYGALELKFGPYRPNMDAQPGISGTPYKDTFGSEESMFLSTLELDWQFLRVIDLSLGLGGSIGVMREKTKAKTESGQESNDETSVNVIPFSLLAVLRVDVLADELSIPLIPYFKGGVCWYIWWSRNAGNTTHRGGTPGWVLIPGIALRLDQFDKISARTIDNEVGINHAFIFFEAMFARVDGFGGEDNAYLSPTNFGDVKGTWQAGLGVEF